MSKLSVTIDGRTFDVEVRIPPRCDGTELTVIVDGQELQVAVSCVDGPERIEWILIEGQAHELLVDHDLHWLRSHNGLHHLEVHDLEATVVRPASGDGRVKAPIPGLITRVFISVGRPRRGRAADPGARGHEDGERDPCAAWRRGQPA